MADFESFYRRDLFPIRVSDFVPYRRGEMLVYSPLSHGMALVDENELPRLQNELETDGSFSDAGLQSLIDDRTEPVPNYVNSPDEVFALTVLPNNICNFSCSYC